MRNETKRSLGIGGGERYGFNDSEEVLMVREQRVTVVRFQGIGICYNFTLFCALRVVIPYALFVTLATLCVGL
jgi:hypothetical protein